MQKLLLLSIISLIIVSCKNDIKQEEPISKNSENKLSIKHANGLKINYFDDYKTIELSTPWPDADRGYTYALINKGITLSNANQFDAIIEVPVENIVVTSTTHIPSLEMLGEANSLVGFPNLSYISSEVTRDLINAGAVVELGKNEDINTEVLIELSPSVVVGFAVDASNKTFSTIQETGIPVMYNSDWTETTPLGKAEWIKFFGALFNKEKEADSIFNTIEQEYLKAKEIASEAKYRPTVLSGAMYKDVWYMPNGDSWAAQFITDANGKYLWKESSGTGSLSYNLETVLDKGISADYWVGPGQFTSLQQMTDAHNVYGKFEAFKQQKVYSFTTNKGATGGVIYYELAPNRPDLVLKDIIKILHPELLPDHRLYFFSPLR